MATLDQLKPGKSAIIKNILCSGPLYQRMLEMGLMEGTQVWLVRVAPLGDPIEILIHGYHLSLRKTEASMVEIEHE